MSKFDAKVIRLSGEPVVLTIDSRSLDDGSSSLKIETGSDEDWQVLRCPLVKFGDEAGGEEEGTST